MSAIDQDQGARARDFAIRPLSPAIGVEVLGVDLAKPLGDSEFARIRRAWEENCIALFRGQSFDEAAQVSFAARFGPLGGMVNDQDPLKHGQYRSVLYVSNIRVDGKLTGILPDGEMFFHSDTCYIERPAMASMLFAMEVPSAGGHTLYANGFRAYETLPEEVKRRLAGKRALNVYDYEGNPTHRAVSLPKDVKQFAHPVFRTHPPTGRKSLYVNRLMTWSILDMPKAESRDTLEYLFDHQEKPEFVYEHAWRPGDVILWDDRSCLHARTDFDPNERRRLRRVTVLGETPYE
ncbi:MAG TPA: TauD/TfdA family dioxygenase [Stellaceae bacterium]|nr:TauD/TfdA family dioxygenase [Stellaceae bacterium]